MIYLSATQPASDENAREKNKSLSDGCPYHQIRARAPRFQLNCRASHHVHEAQFTIWHCVWVISGFQAEWDAFGIERCSPFSASRHLRPSHRNNWDDPNTCATDRECPNSSSINPIKHAVEKRFNFAWKVLLAPVINAIIFPPISRAVFGRRQWEDASNNAINLISIDPVSRSLMAF